MPIHYPELQLNGLDAAIPAWHGTITEADLLPICQQVSDGGGRLVALWGSDERQHNNGFALHVALVNETGLVCLSLPIPSDENSPLLNPSYPDLSHIFYAANRMQRAVFDLLGIEARGAPDSRPWLRHAAWTDKQFPLRKDFLPASEKSPIEQDHYPFLQVEGQGVHEIPVGPVHAGIIEPGHFRFSIVGEKVLKLEERLGYTHKGTEKRFEGMSVQQGAKLAGRVCGDSTVAYAWAYAMAAESIAHLTPPDRAFWLRGLLLERERIANHLGDLGYLGNDVAFSFGFAQFWILKEQVLRNNATLFGHRYLMDSIIPGGVAVDISLEGKALIEQECVLLEEKVHLLRSIYEEHAGVQDRFIGAGKVEPKLAAQLGLCGLAGRASAQAWDTRVQFPCAPYHKLDVQMATYRNGDVAARVIVRFDELFESLRLQRKILVNLLGADELARPLETLPAHQFGVGMVEGWRGEVLVAIHTNAEGKLARVHPHDPSWQNWPVLEHAIMGNIVPDFPLINKSFNLSYSGHDL